MSNATEQHPAADRLERFGLGGVDAAEFEQIANHVAECSTCCGRLKDVPDDSLAQLVRAATTLDSWGGETLPEPGRAPSVPSVPAELRNHPRYEIIRPLGKGGMGVVFEAKHRLMNRQVALKVIGRRFTSNRTAVERFQREVRAAAQLAHANIVTAFDAEQAGDVHFLVMELVDGQSLAQIVQKRGPLPVREAVGLIRQAAMGLHHAHQQGMVHRDVKPQNLMVTKSGQVKILDFGLARLAQECHQQEVPSTWFPTRGWCGRKAVR